MRQNGISAAFPMYYFQLFYNLILDSYYILMGMDIMILM